MHFNTKYIFQGDSKRDIDRKINYNFDQILSFAVGPNGHIGVKGPTGFPGPAGKKGLSGDTGRRATIWFNQSSQPLSSSSIQGDLWIDESTSSSDVKSLGPTGTWTNTGYSLFSSDYFRSYSGVSGPAGVTDKFVIAFNNSGVLNELDTSLVISDQNLNALNSNPNRSKLLVSTDDQTSNPIFSFVKSTVVNSGSPSFYWKSTGSSVGLAFRSSSNLFINSLLSLGVDTSTARTLLFGNQMIISAGSGISFRHSSDFYFNSNTTIGTGSYFILNTSNVVISSSYYRSNEPTKVISGESGTTVFNTAKTISNPGIFSYGLRVDVTNGVSNPFEFLDSNGAQIFSSRPKGSLGSGYNLQTIFGSTGGFSPGGTAGPYFYNVRGLNEVRFTTAPSSRLCYKYGSTPTGFGTSISSVVDLTQLSLWSSNFIMVTPAWSGASSFYLYIPTPLTPTEPLFYVNQEGSSSVEYSYFGNPQVRSGATHYRIFANDIVNTSTKATAQGKILGLVWDYKNYSGSTYTGSTRYYMKFPPNKDTGTLFNGCSYVDLFWSYITSSTNGNPKVFWKTCTGSAGFINITNKYVIGAVVTVPPPPPPPPPSGGSSSGGGGTTYPPPPSGCFVKGTLVTLANGQSIEIEMISIGDIVLTYNQVLGINEPGNVIGLLRPINNSLIVITLEDSTVIESTPEHPYWNSDRSEWASVVPDLTLIVHNMKVNSLSVGDRLLNENGNSIRILSIESKESLDQVTYNLSIDSNPTYYANGFLVHNKRDTSFIGAF